MRKTSIALSIAAALTAPALVASASTKAGRQVNPNVPRHIPSTIRAIHGSTLYDQTGTADVGAQVLHDSNSPSYDSEAADDFVVTDAAGWTVTQFNFQTNFNGSTPVDPVYDVVVYPDNAGSPGDTPSCTYAGLAGTLDGSLANVTVPLSSNCVLAQGTYWVSFTPNYHFPPQAFWPTLAGATIGGEGVWRNPGGAYGTTCSTTAWSPITSCTGFLTSPIGGGDTNFTFQVIGTVGGGGGDTCDPGEFCLVTTVGTDAPPACGTTDTIDATVGDQINYCYTVTNNTAVALDYHTLSDNIGGTVFTLMNQSVPAGGTFQYNRVLTAGATETRNSTWTAQDVPPGYAAEVTGGGPGNDRIFCDGFDGTPCADLPGGGFVDITGTGTPLDNGDDEAIAVTMPFSFNLYGSTSNQLCVDNNGFVLFNTTNCPTGGLYTNGSLPDTSLPAAAILPLWDDFDSESGNVYYDTRGTTPNRQFIIEWFNRVHYNGSTNTDGATFELILNEDGTLQFEYSDVDFTGGAEGDCSGGACATIGLQNDETLFNQFSAFEASVTDNSGIKWTPTNPQSFVGTDSVTVNVGAPDINVSPASLSGNVGAGASTTTPLDIQNLGNRDLVWTTDEAPADRHFPSLWAPRYMVPAPNAAERALTMAKARQTAPKSHGKAHRPHSPLGAAVPAYIMDHNFDTGDQFGTIDAANPGTFNAIAPAPADLYKTGTFVANDFTKEYVAAINGSLSIGTIDTTSGALTVLPSSGPPTVSGEIWVGLKWDSSTGTLFGAGCDGTGAGCHLYTVDPITGAVTEGPEITGIDAGGGAFLIDIAIDQSGLMYGVEFFSGDFVAIDKTTGAGTSIGNTGLAPAYVQALDFDLSTNTLYWASYDQNLIGAMYTINLSDGSLTSVGNLANSDEQYAMAIAVPSGPCGTPADQPWLSLNPTGGTTAGGTDTPVTVTIDATGHVDGDTLAGTICVRSNDPDEGTVPVPVEYTVGPGGGNPNIIDSGVLDTTITNDGNGLYINWLTGATCSTASGGGCNVTAQAFDFNPYGSGGLTFWWGIAIADTSFCVWDGTACTPLSSGATIGSGSSFGSGTGTLFRAGGTLYMGFSFVNTNTAAVNYGYAKITTTGATGFPATLNEYWYDNSGAAIVIP